MKGFYFALAATIVWGISPVLAKLGVKDIDPTNAFLIRTSGVLIFFITFFLFFVRRNIYAGVPYISIVYLIAEAFCGAFLGQFLYYNAQNFGKHQK